MARGAAWPESTWLTSVDGQHRSILSQLACEMAANAALHSHSALPGGQFTVRAELSPGDYVWIEVEDQGGFWTQPSPNPARDTDWTSSMHSPPIGASTVTTAPAPSGFVSTGRRTRHRPHTPRQAPASASQHATGNRPRQTPAPRPSSPAPGPRARLSGGPPSSTASDCGTCAACTACHRTSSLLGPG